MQTELSDPDTTGALDCVETGRYPLDQPDSAAYQSRVSEARAALERDG